MKTKIISIFTILFLLAAVMSAQQLNQKEIAVTIYNQNLGVVKDLREITIPEGISTLRIVDVAQLIDPTSVHIKLNGDVLEQNYQYDLVNLAKILNKYVDRNISMISKTGELIEGKLISANGGQIVIQNKTGGLLMIPNFNEYRINVAALPEGLITKPTLVWMVNSKTNKKQDVEISYQTGGMNWHAEYVAVLNKDDSKMDLNSWVSIENNSGTTYKDAKIKLVAGDIHRATQPAPTPRYEKNIAYASAEDQFQEQAFFEYHIYKLQRPATIANNETKQISLFEANNISINKKYLYESGAYNQPDGKVSVVVEFVNSKKNNLGVPMPKGKVRVYKSDGDAIEFIGEDFVDHTPKNEKVRLTIGNAFDVVAKEKMTNHRKISNRSYEQSWEIKLSNRKDEDIVVDVVKTLGLNWEVIDSSSEFVKEDARTISFKIPVKKDGTTKLTLTVRYNN
ncbi:MAG: DUF4139 domain-containing protein [Chlorobi bacterium]|nr:DUF4139 domain-containing protein [Chlorobiota bacterium]